MVGKLATTEMLSLINTSNSNGKSNTGVGNGIDMVGLGSNYAPDSSQPKSMVYEENKISSEGCAFQDKSGGSFDAIADLSVLMKSSKSIQIEQQFRQQNHEREAREGRRRGAERRDHSPGSTARREQWSTPGVG
ncbi:uncharacterized protein DS421_14g469740 [Arachis hypogaea]|nr:uncharacterized protein DS421_14g469740 [Arachis hypogaea]